MPKKTGHDGVTPGDSSSMVGNSDTVAVIDIGSNSIRLAIADVLPDGTCQILERAKQAVGLGHDTFISGKISNQTIAASITVLRKYQTLIGEYKANHVIVVASSAVREAANADIFVERVTRSTGLNIRMVEPSEEGRLVVAAVVHSMRDELARVDGLSAIAEVGGGSTWITLLDRNGVVAAESYDLGSIRIQEALNTFQERPQRAADIIRHHVANMVAIIKRTIPLGQVRCFVAVGGDVRIALDLDRTGTRTKAMPLKDLDAAVAEFVPLTTVGISRKYTVPFSDAETLVPALLTYQEIARATAAEQIVVSALSLRDGLLWNFSQRLNGRDDQLLADGIAQSARTIGQKYHYDSAHAQKVAQLAACIFDSLAAQHGLGPRQRTILHIAAILHDIGDFVSRRAHHKHSYYLIVNSEIFGLRKDEIALVAHIARYHRRSAPKSTHQEYASLEPEKRILINKLAAILRVADALDRNRQQHVRSIEVTVTGDELRIMAQTTGEIEVDTVAVAQKLGLMEEVYGLRVMIDAVPVQDGGAA